jgi:hypothetical protein
MIIEKGSANMVHEEMTVHQALCELKTLNKRVLKAIDATIPVAIKEAGAKKIDGVATEVFAENARSAHDSAVGLIKRQRAIKAAVNQYNAEKQIEVCGRKYTIAQAIWEMQHGTNEDHALLTRYTNILSGANSQIERFNGSDLDRRAEAFCASMYGNKEKCDPKDFNATLEDYKAKHTMELFDPLNIRKIIADIDKEVSDFEANVDAAIQVANATTTLVIEY